jgi:hypothetical protein
MAPYSWSLTRPAGLSFNELTRERRIALLADLDQLATHPFRDGHFRYADSDNREIRVWVRDDLVIHYWLDHAVREVRVNRIESAEPI